jgi:hypothetical protein
MCCSLVAQSAGERSPIQLDNKPGRELISLLYNETGFDRKEQLTPLKAHRLMFLWME